jgi:hypothetical protein
MTNPIFYRAAKAAALATDTPAVIVFYLGEEIGAVNVAAYTADPENEQKLQESAMLLAERIRLDSVQAVAHERAAEEPPTVRFDV